MAVSKANIAPQTETALSTTKNQQPRMVRISVASKENPKRSEDYPIDELTYWSSTIKSAIENPGTDPVPHVARSGTDSDNQAFVVLKGVPQDVYFSCLDNIISTSKIPNSKEHRGKKANIPSTGDLFETALLYRAGVYLGTDYIAGITLSIMQRKATSLVTRREAELIYQHFRPNTVPRQMVIESIAEECLARVFDGRVRRNEAWNEVFAPFEGMRELYHEVSKYYYHHERLRVAKRTQIVERKRTARREQERLCALMQPLPKPVPEVEAVNGGAGEKAE